MILLLAVLAGLLAGLLRAYIFRRSFQVPELRLVWLVPAAFIPQLLAFQLPATREITPDFLAAIALVSSQLLLLIFAWVNRHQPGFWMLGLGLTLNLVVIVLNGGLMPISPETVARLEPDAPPGTWSTGERFRAGKDIILPAGSTRLWQLSDFFLLPDWMPYKVAFSLGDIFIAAGAFSLLWTLGDSRHPSSRFE